MRFLTFFLAAGAAFTLVATEASADNLVDRPITLPTFRASADAALGFGQRPTSDGQTAGVGANVEGALGLPLGFEVGARTGFRFDDQAKASSADFAGRLFDPEGGYNLGIRALANPEVRVRKSFLLDVEAVQLATELRLFLPVDDHTALGAEIGVPVRVRIPTRMRIDSGVFIPYVMSRFGLPDYWAVSVPAQVFFQAGDAFFGPLTGIRFNHYGELPGDKKVDITAGLGVGYTVGPMDIKAQIYTPRINDASWSKLIGGGVGVGLAFGP